MTVIEHRQRGSLNMRTGEYAAATQSTFEATMYTVGRDVWASSALSIDGILDLATLFAAKASNNSGLRLQVSEHRTKDRLTLSRSNWRWTGKRFERDRVDIIEWFIENANTGRSYSSECTNYPAGVVRSVEDALKAARPFLTRNVDGEERILESETDGCGLRVRVDELHAGDIVRTRRFVARRTLTGIEIIQN